MFMNIFRKTEIQCVHVCVSCRITIITWHLLCIFTQADMQSLVPVTTDRILRVITGPNEALKSKIRSAIQFSNI